MRYGGFVPAVVGNIRTIRTARGHGFLVEHKPEEGQHHAEVSYLPDGELKRADKNELKYALEKVFDVLVPHTCPSTSAL